MSTADQGGTRRRRRRAHRPAGPVAERAAAAEPAGRDRPAAPSGHQPPAHDVPPAAADSQPPPKAGGPATGSGAATRTAGQRRPGRPDGGRRSRDSERGWRELAGNSPSQLGLSGALRARDVARPGPDELAAAERDLQLVRRQWVPPVDDPPAGTGH